MWEKLLKIFVYVISNFVNTIKRSIGRKLPPTPLKSPFSNEMIDIDISITSSILFNNGNNSFSAVPTTTFWCLCWRKKKYYTFNNSNNTIKIIKWLDKSNRDQGLINNGKTLWFIDQYGIKVIVDIENIASLSTINNEKSNRFNNELLQGLGI